MDGFPVGGVIRIFRLQGHFLAGAVPFYDAVVFSGQAAFGGDDGSAALGPHIDPAQLDHKVGTAMNGVDFLHPTAALALPLRPQPGNILDVVADDGIGVLVKGGYNHRPQFPRLNRLIGFRVDQFHDKGILPDVMPAGVGTFRGYGLDFVHPVGVVSRHAPSLPHQVGFAKTFNQFQRQIPAHFQPHIPGDLGHINQVFGETDQGVDLPFLGDFQSAGGAGNDAGAGRYRNAAQPLPQGFVGRVSGVVGGIKQGIHHHIAGLEPVPVVGTGAQNVAHFPIPGAVESGPGFAGGAAAGMDAPGEAAGPHIGADIIAKGRMGIHGLADVLHGIHWQLFQVGQGLDVAGLDPGGVPFAAVERHGVGPFHGGPQAPLLQSPGFLDALPKDAAEKIRGRRIFPHQFGKVQGLVVERHFVQILQDHNGAS